MLGTNIESGWAQDVPSEQEGLEQSGTIGNGTIDGAIGESMDSKPIENISMGIEENEMQLNGHPNYISDVTQTQSIVPDQEIETTPEPEIGEQNIPCPICQNTISFYTTPCPYCESDLVWE